MTLDFKFKGVENVKKIGENNQVALVVVVGTVTTF